MRSLILAICVAAVFAIWASGSRAMDVGDAAANSSGSEATGVSTTQR